MIDTYKTHMDELYQQKKAWYKTKAGIIFLSILGIIGLISLLFIALTGYYLLKIKKGEFAYLAQEFNSSENKNTSNYQTVDNPEKLIRSFNPTIGSKNAQIQIIMFIDFECPSCQKAYQPFKEATEKFGDIINITFKHFPLESIHPNALAAANAAACAAEQNKFWEYYDMLFTQKKLEKTNFKSYAQKLGLNTASFDSCLETEKYRENIETDMLDGASIGIRATPTYIVNNIKIEGVLSQEDWSNILLQFLQK